MDRYEPQVCDCGLQERILLFAPVQPLEELSHFAVDAGSRGRLVVNFMATDWPGDDLHQALTVVPPSPYPKFIPGPADFREQIRMPIEQAFLGQRLVELLRCVQHHLNYTRSEE